MKITLKHYPYDPNLKHRVEADLLILNPAPEAFVAFCNKIGSWPEVIVHDGKFFIMQDWDNKLSAVYGESTGYVLENSESPKIIVP